VRLDSLLNGIGRPVAYYPAMARAFGGVKRALWICQFAYWKGKEADPNGWIHKTEDEINHETGLSSREQKGIRKWLLEFKLCEIEKRGAPAKNYYLHDWELITHEWNKRRTSEDKTAPLVRTKEPDKSGQNDTTNITEITPETTQREEESSPLKELVKTFDEIYENECKEKPRHFDQNGNTTRTRKGLDELFSMGVTPKQLRKIMEAAGEPQFRFNTHYLASDFNVLLAKTRTDPNKCPSCGGANLNNWYGDKYCGDCGKRWNVSGQKYEYRKGEPERIGQ